MFSFGPLCISKNDELCGNLPISWRRWRWRWWCWCCWCLFRVLKDYELEQRWLVCFEHKSDGLTISAYSNIRITVSSKSVQPFKYFCFFFFFVSNFAIDSGNILVLSKFCDLFYYLFYWMHTFYLSSYSSLSLSLSHSSAVGRYETGTLYNKCLQLNNMTQSNRFRKSKFMRWSKQTKI